MKGLKTSTSFGAFFIWSLLILSAVQAAADNIYPQEFLESLQIPNRSTFSSLQEFHQTVYRQIAWPSTSTPIPDREQLFLQIFTDYSKVRDRMSLSDDYRKKVRLLQADLESIHPTFNSRYWHDLVHHQK